MKAVRIAVAVLGLLAAFFAGGVQAAPLSYGFVVTFDNGPLDNQVFRGSLSVDGDDCPGGLCSGSFAPNSLARTLLSLNITVAGNAYTAASDTGFPAFPVATFNAGRLFSIDFDGLVAGNELILAGILSQPGVAVYDPAVGLTSTGI